MSANNILYLAFCWLQCIKWASYCCEHGNNGCQFPVNVCFGAVLADINLQCFNEYSTLLMAPVSMRVPYSPQQQQNIVSASMCSFNCQPFLIISDSWCQTLWQIARLVHSTKQWKVQCSEEKKAYAGTPQLGHMHNESDAIKRGF